MSIGYGWYGFFITGFVGMVIGIHLFHRWKRKQEYAKLVELIDCPFKFLIHFDESGDEFLLFNLGENSMLWCEYTFGVKSDGIYGVNALILKGLNGKRTENIELGIGQSVFPLIENMRQFEAWAEDKSFEYEWDALFEDTWDEMKKKLDNLRFLETKSKEKEKKSK